MANFEEQRKHKRIPMRTKVFVSGEGFLRFKTQTMDLSEGGLFLEGKALSSLNADDVIEVQLAEGPQQSQILKARIAWTNNYGAGIEYLT